MIWGHWGLKPFAAAANRPLSQHFLEKKKKKICPFTFLTRPQMN